MLRSLVLLVIVGNLLFLAWSQDWLSTWVAPPMVGERDPGRLKAQLRPETIQVLTPKAASAALAAARAAAESCAVLGPLALTAVESTEASLMAAGIPREAWARRDVPEDSTRVWLRFERATPALREQLRASGFSAETCQAP